MDHPVSNSAELQSALDNANAGDTITLADGPYSGDFTLSKSGEPDKRIVVRAANSRKAVFNNALFTMSGNYGVIRGMTFDNGQVTVRGNHNRVTRNVFQNGNRGGNKARLNSAVLVEGSHNRVSYNEVKNWQRRGLRVVPNKDIGTPKRNRLHHNHLHHFSASGNSGDALQIGSGAKHTGINTETIIEHNLVEQAEADAELLSVKSSESIIRFNTFRDSDATVQIRHGTNNKLIGNTVINMKAVAVYGDNNEVTGNDLQNTPLIIRCGNITQAQLADGEKKGHPAARNTHVEANIVDPFIGVGVRIPGGDASRGKAARNTKLINNTGPIIRDEEHEMERNTEEISDPTRLPVPQAVLVTLDDVGPAAVGDDV